METLSHDAWLAEGRRLFGEDFLDWRFVCPSCGHVAAVRDWKTAGASIDAVAFSCVGRWLDDHRATAKAAFKNAGGPCDYTGGGLIKLNPVAVDLQGKIQHFFRFADPSLEAKKEIDPCSAS
ncbi:MAG: VVA0879 family protein [Candidatus Competibacter sp.]|jgi:hypothetical protein